jgi:hypothetical protein
MAEMKTKETRASVADFIASVPDARKRADAKTLLRIMKRVTGQPARMWGPSLVGFDRYHYKYESGREGDWFVAGFSPRTAALTLYIMPGFEPFKTLMARLGKYKTGRSCLYIRKLDDVDMDVLEQLIRESYTYMKKR